MDMSSEELRKLIEVDPITTIIRSGRLRWYGHVLRKFLRGLGEEMYGHQR